MLDELKAIAHALAGGRWWWGLVVSALLFVGSIVLVTVIVVSWSPDHFKRSGHDGLWEHRHPVVRAAGMILKNVAGALLFLLGAVMALPGVPGQGLLTMLIGLTLLDFPGKRGLERRLLGRPMILKTINRLRSRFHKPALELDADAGAGAGAA
jgi:hypothetical protein